MSTEPEQKPADNEIAAEIEGFESEPKPQPAPPDAPKPREVAPAAVEIPEKREIERKPEPMPEPKAEENPPKWGAWPESATKNREAWLHEAARRIARNGAADLPGVLFSVGWGKGGTRGAKNWSVVENADAKGWQIFIRPNVAERVEALACTILAMRQLGVRLWNAKLLEGMGRDWPAYPQPDVTHEHKQQVTRLIKCHCTACGYIVRTTQRWIATGMPLCPCENPPRAMVSEGGEP